MPKPVATFTVTPLCRACKVPMGRNYERMVWVCPLCGKETTREEEGHR